MHIDNEITDKSNTVDLEHNNNFNFLRLLFASLVILSHTFELIDGNRSRELLTRIFGTISFGELAVDGFFLISGYLIVKSWNSGPNLFVFLSKRILRIYPGFIVASLICAFVVAPLGAEPTSYFSQFDFTRFVWGIIRLGGPYIPAVFEGHPYPSVNGSMWTIGYEFACYISVLFLGLTGCIKLRWIWLLITAGFYAVMIMQQLFGVHWSALGHLFTLDHPLLRFSTFFFSGGAYLIFRDKIKFSPRTACLVGLILIPAMFWSSTVELALASLGGYLLLYVAFARFSIIRRFQTTPDISYGLYLYGWPIQKLLIWYFPTLGPFWIIIISMTTGLITGLLSWQLVEKQFLKLKSIGRTRAKQIQYQTES